MGRGWWAAALGEPEGRAPARLVLADATAAFRRAEQRRAEREAQLLARAQAAMSGWGPVKPSGCCCVADLARRRGPQPAALHELEEWLDAAERLARHGAGAALDDARAHCVAFARLALT